MFQDRYKQKIIENDEYIEALIAYIHLNPVEAGFVQFPKDYLWSSYLEYAAGKSGLCNRELVEGCGLKGLSFVQYINFARKISPLEAFDEEKD